MAKRILRRIVKVVAVVAGVVFLFDNSLSGRAFLVLLASIATLGVCLIVWLIFGLDEKTESQANKPQSDSEETLN
jgi:hypothetical protein